VGYFSQNDDTVTGTVFRARIARSPGARTTNPSHANPDKRVATPLGVSLGAVKNSRGVATHHNTLPEENPFRLLTLYY
jgi:hypothetical protein